ncbi:MAG: 30S ribosomal protein S4 [Erysipelotrichaceae bacterium]|nr:30S ribosomal protein S4 [Erysipelotrichaceae bacterium]
MARMTGPVWKQSRRLSFSVLETGEELTKRSYIPGQHGPTKRVKLSPYGQQLAEKQKIRYMYGLNEKQFANTFFKAVKAKGVTGTVFLQLLESRLDNVVYRMGLARTRRGARQLVNHGHILVNGKKVDIPSYQCKPGSIIEVKDRMKNAAAIKDALDATLNTVDYVTFDPQTMKGEFVRLPERKELNSEINELLVVEYYNRKM